MALTIDGSRYAITWNYISDSLQMSGSIKKRIKYGTFVKDLECPNALIKIGCRFAYTYNPIFGYILKFYYTTNGTTWVDSGFTQSIASFSTLSVTSQQTSNTGLGYINIEADSVDETIFGNGMNGVYTKGSENYPFTYNEMYDRIKYGGVGKFADRYKCRNWRQVTNSLFAIDKSKQFEIDVWDPHKYGPWMLRFLYGADFTGVTLMNGIMYNISRGTITNLLITTTFNMFITWNDNYGVGNKIILVRCANRFTGVDKRSDIIGSTMKSVSGIATLEDF